MKILLVDDEPMVLLDLEMAAEAAGLAPVCAVSLPEALGQLDSHHDFAVGVLDVTLGKGETCVPIASALADLSVPFVLFTGDLDRQDETVRSLAAPTIPKPAPAKQVIEKAMGLVAD